MKPHFHTQASLQADCFIERVEADISECLLELCVRAGVHSPTKSVSVPARRSIS